MMGAVGQWMLSVVTISVLVSLVERLTPTGSLRKIANFIGGLLLLLTILRPVMEWEGASLNLDFDGYQQEMDAVTQALSQEQEKALQAGMIEACQAYILEKANTLGVVCKVDVEVECGAEGMWVPVAVTLDVAYHQALSTYITQTLGIGQEGQRWYEED